MLYISIIVITFFLGLFVISLRHKDDRLTNIDKKEHKLYFLYPMAGLLLIKTGLEKRLLKKIGISGKIRSIYVSDYNDNQIRLYWYQKISLFILLVFTFSWVTMLISLQSSPPPLPANRIERPDIGEGDRNLSLSFRMENEKDKEEVYEDSLVIENKERSYTDEEWREVISKAIPYLEQAVLGQNESLDHVVKDLIFISNIPDTGIIVQWLPGDSKLINSSGRIFNENIDEKGVYTQVKAVLRYRDRVVEHTIPLIIWPARVDKTTLIYRELNKAIAAADEESDTSREWQLPDRIEDYHITWGWPESNTAAQTFILGIIGAVILWLMMDRALDDKVKKRNNQMLLDYPEIINKFSLLVNAGMTIKQAWSKISEDYKQSNRTNKRQMRYAYEEMLLTLNELRLGISEVNAYEEFGQRTGLMPYMKFSSMLVQNLKKGNRNMIEILKQEAREALHERKETTKRLGEEASTKLLGPMMIMLLIILVIILVPAFVSIKI